jgi:Flp pilus assembly pilin Flp
MRVLRRAAESGLCLVRRAALDESGPTVIEYALMIALVILMAVGMIAAVRTGLGNVFGRTANCLNSAGGTNAPSSC